MLSNKFFLVFCSLTEEGRMLFSEFMTTGFKPRYFQGQVFDLGDQRFVQIRIFDILSGRTRALMINSFLSGKIPSRLVATAVVEAMISLGEGRRIPPLQTQGLLDEAHSHF